MKLYIKLFFALLITAVFIQAQKEAEVKKEENEDGPSDVIIHLKNVNPNQITILKHPKAEEEIVSSPKNSREKHKDKMAEAASKIRESKEHAYSALEHSIKQLSKVIKAFEVPKTIKEKLKKYSEMASELAKDLKSKLKPKEKDDAKAEESHPHPAPRQTLPQAPEIPNIPNIPPGYPQFPHVPPGYFPGFQYPVSPPVAPKPEIPPLKAKRIEKLQQLVDKNPRMTDFAERLDKSEVGKRLKRKIKDLGISLPEPKSAHEIFAEKLSNMIDLKKKLTEAESTADKLKHFLELSSLVEQL